MSLDIKRAVVSHEMLHKYLDDLIKIGIHVPSDVRGASELLRSLLRNEEFEQNK